MMKKQKPLVLGVSGSLRKQSSNTRLLTAVGGLLSGMAFRISEGLADLPQFNPDMDGEEGPVLEAVKNWRSELQAADAIVICTPEYARGVPGSLKNALDWTVSSGEWLNKPTAVISASPHPDGGSAALQSLVLTLRTMSADVADEAVLAVPFAGKIFGSDGGVTEPNVLNSLDRLVKKLMQSV